MILEVEGNITTEVPRMEMVQAYPLSPAHWVVGHMEGMVHGKILERYSYMDYCAGSLVVGVRYGGVEKWV